ncbi:pectinesterase family protein [Actinoplanes oblitus]|uniref:Pectinesterase n=1 Tax=Actinoplanes oblitus TaxID=3040509 RepID=A0ABY8WMI4_9ACTN|nr:pectinesterase family protein [Actinoplanes oblitus]WIM97544.1 pectinesterase family protein [Actinoplanes oblitus]
MATRKRKLLGAAAVLAVPAGLIGWAVLPSEAATAPAAGGVYTLAVKKSGMCVDVPSAAKDDKALLQQWGCTANAAWQQFQVVARGGNFQLKNVNSGKCVDVPSASTASGVQLWQYTCGTGTNQQWRFVASGTGTFQIVSVSSGLCVSDQAASTASGAAIIQETCTANSNKQWAFTPVTGATTPPTGGTFTVASDGTGKYRTVQAAIDAVPANNTSRATITIKPGTYREVLTVPSNKPFVTLAGGGGAASDTVLVYNNSAHTSGTSGSASVSVAGKDFVASNLTIANDYDENTYEDGDQAVALKLGGDRATLDNVRLLGDQDTFLLNSGRSYIKNSYVEGTVDFIFGGGTGVFNATRVHEKRTTGGPITAARTDAANPYGFLFYKCTITGATNNTTQLGRPWGPDAQVLYRESSLSATVKTAQPWIDMSSNSWQNARFLEYRNTGSGATTNSNRPQLSDAQAANHTPQKYLAGTDNWNPVG